MINYTPPNLKFASMLALISRTLLSLCYETANADGQSNIEIILPSRTAADLGMQKASLSTLVDSFLAQVT